jgi:hypothetical protein
MMMRRTLLAVAVTVWTCAACSGEPPVDIGEHVTGSKLSDYAGTWDGYAEAFTFRPSTSDRIRVTIDESGQGTIEFGDQPLIPPPTDPDIAYPPDVPGAGGVRSGFLYPIHAAVVEFDHLSFGVWPADTMATWCALQTPVQASTNTGYACSHTDWAVRSWYSTCTLSGPDGVEVVVDCTKLALCESTLCVCIESGCDGQQPPPNDRRGDFGVQLSGNLEDLGTRLVGTLRQLDASDDVRAIVKLRRN